MTYAVVNKAQHYVSKEAIRKHMWREYIIHAYVTDAQQDKIEGILASNYWYINYADRQVTDKVHKKMLELERMAIDKVMLGDNHYSL